MIAKANRQPTEASEICRAIEAQFGRGLRASVLRRCGTNEADADDIVQEAFLRMSQAIDAGRFPGVTIDNWNKEPFFESLRRFLFGSARFIRLEFYRHNATIGLHDPATIAGWISHSPSTLIDIKEAIDKCTTAQRRVFALRQERRKFKEIGAELGIPTATARIIYFRAKQSLQALLKDYASECSSIRARYA